MMQMAEKDQPTGDRSHKDNRMAFFIMPTMLLRSLRHNAARHLKEDDVRALLYDCGLDCGKMMVQKMDISTEDQVDVGDTITALWIEIGLGRLHVKSSEEGELVVACDDSTEAVSNGHTGKMICDLTRGYLVGIASTLSGFEWTCTETACLSHGEPECTYVLKAK
jgi:predicted hydrocarbon binding protein